jgi:3-phosphoshikimate 1-carboxyvinyltransferase
MDKSQPFEVPSGRVARGRVTAPGSKSHAIRVLACQAAAGSCVPRLRISGAVGDDIAVASREIHAFHEQERRRVLPNTVDLGGSATAFRFFCALASLRTHPTILTGDDSLRRRPMNGVVDAVRELGVKAEGTPGPRGHYAPITVSGGPPRSNRAVVDASESSHPLSALLIVGAAIPGGLEIRTKGAVASRPYVDLTVWTMRRGGIDVVVGDREWSVRRGGYCGWEVDDDEEVFAPIVGDWSSAAFPMAAAAVGDGDVEIDGLDFDSPQADRRIVDLLRDFGATVDATGTGVRVRGGDRRPLDVDLRDAPDLAPLVGALGCVASGTTRVRGAAHLRIKESDRIATVVAAARALGCEARELPDGFEIVGPAKHGGLVETKHDHRIAMAFAVAGLAIKGVVIDDPACVAKSYPGFWEDLARLTSGQEEPPR